MARKDSKENPFEIINKKVALHPVWLTVSEAAKIMGANMKTVRRAIQEQVIKYKIVGERYFIDFSSLLHFVYSRTKLTNKFNEFGIGQYVEKWRDEKSLLKPRRPMALLDEDSTEDPMIENDKSDDNADRTNIA